MYRLAVIITLSFVIHSAFSGVRAAATSSKLVSLVTTPASISSSFPDTTEEKPVTHDQILIALWRELALDKADYREKTASMLSLPSTPISAAVKKYSVQKIDAMIKIIENDIEEVAQALQDLASSTHEYTDKYIHFYNSQKEFYENKKEFCCAIKQGIEQLKVEELSL